MNTPLVTEYKGNPMIILNPTDRFQFQFGISKAKLILQHIDAIQDFVNNIHTFAKGQVLPEVKQMANMPIAPVSSIDDDTNLI